MGFEVTSFINGCGNSDNPVIPGSGVSFTKEVLPILRQNCALSGCHQSRLTNSDNLELTSWQSIMYGGYDHGAPIIPYNAFWSGLVSHISNDTNISIIARPRMPEWRPGTTTGRYLDPNEIQTIVKWINEGAKDDNGNIAFSNITNKAFITNQASDYVAVVNTDNNFLVRLIPVGGRQGASTLAVPHHITIDNQGRYFYIADINEGFIEKYDAMSYERAGRTYLGSSPAEVFLNNAGTTGYVTNWDATGLDRSVKVIDTKSFSLISTITDVRMKATHGGRVLHNDSLFICASQLSEYVLFISMPDNVLIDATPIANDVPPNGNGTAAQKYQPYGIAITRDDKFAFITCPRANDVRVVDLKSHQVVNIIPVGHNPVMIEVSPDNKWCYVPCRNDNSVSVIDVSTQTVVYTIPDVGVQPHGVDFTSNGHFAYVTCESQGTNNPFIHHPVTQNVKPGTTAVIDVWAGHEKTDNIEMASFPNGIAITPR